MLFSAHPEHTEKKMPGLGFDIVYGKEVSVSTDRCGLNYIYTDNKPNDNNKRENKERKEKRKTLTMASVSVMAAGAKMVCTMNLCLLFSLGS